MSSILWFKLALFLWTPPAEALEQIPLEDFSSNLNSAATQQGVTFFQTIDLDQRKMLNEVYWVYQHETGSLARFTGNPMPRFCNMVAAVGDQFVALSIKNGMVGVVGPDLHVKENKEVRAFFNFPPDLHGEVTFVSPFSGGQVLLTIKQKDRFLLAKFCLKKNLSVVSEYVGEPEAIVSWAYADKTIFQFIENDAVINLVNPDFSVGRVVAPGINSLFKTDQERYSCRNCSGLIKKMIPLPDQLRFEYKELFGADGKQVQNPTRQTKVLTSQKYEIAQDQRLIVGRNKTHDLVYDKDTHSLTLVAQPTLP